MLLTTIYIKFTVSDEELSEVQRLSSRVLIVAAAASSSYKLFALQFHCALITDSRNFRLVEVAKTAQQASVSRPYECMFSSGLKGFIGARGRAKKFQNWNLAVSCLFPAEVKMCMCMAWGIPQKVLMDVHSGGMILPPAFLGNLSRTSIVTVTFLRGRSVARNHT